MNIHKDRIPRYSANNKGYGYVSMSILAKVGKEKTIPCSDAYFIIYGIYAIWV
ncbi:hypothetical protein XSR1_110045 [Xenorhabdus szentirmaii DSM 16338]|uniref:Uncharacterized protein n=1 Tax=Xenorhabdus szentirmaii DSM 16338 TaxID=1427518 RepID=W1IRP9_9GAMM|nr:hypothetical protein XSR1_110045 [Xenorhabdus szentirmaii DSM 16338]